MIEWEDRTYSVGVGDGKGKAAKWKASSQLRELMREYGEVGSEAGDEVLVSVDNNTQRKLGGSKASELDSLWEKMPIENSRNVGLRPVLVFVVVEKFHLSDHLDELEALGLSWMAA